MLTKKESNEIFTRLQKKYIMITGNCIVIRLRDVDKVLEDYTIDTVEEGT